VEKPGANRNWWTSWSLSGVPGDRISALSGRGVGMDVVKKTIESLRGSIDLATQQGAGSAFTPS
jgi:signal transduction histidine kinase